MPTPLNDIRTDDNVANRAQEALWQDPFLDPQGLNLVVNRGVVTLLGLDIAAGTIARAREILDAVAGVRDVLDGTSTALQRAA